MGEPAAPTSPTSGSGEACARTVALVEDHTFLAPLRVAIIGAGISGLAACKEAVEQGLLPTVFEKAHDLGGLWRYDGSGAVSPFLTTNLSRFSCMFSDFPWPAGTPLFPTAQEVHTYIMQYAEHYGLLRYIRFSTEVLKLDQTSDMDWRVTWYVEGKDGAAPAGGEEDFDRVVVASGMASHPIWPDIPGLDEFSGQILHSCDYPGPRFFEGQKVLVVGSAFSGADIALELSETARSVTTVARRAMWYVERGIGGFPLDMAYYHRARRKVTMEKIREKAQTLDEDVAVTQMKEQHQFFKSLLGAVPRPLLQPDTEKDETFISINNGFVDAVKEKRIAVVTHAPQKVEGNQIYFADGTRDSFDVVILATGYRVELPFFSEEQHNLMEYDQNDLFQPFILHKTVWRPELPNLAFVGIYRGNFMSLCELQARWAIGVFSGEVPCPEPADLEKGLEQERAVRRRRPRPQFPHGDYVEFSDDLARLIGVYPGQVLDDPHHDMHKELVECAVIPCQFRLVGPGAKPEVAAEILKDAERTRRLIRKAWKPRNLAEEHVFEALCAFFEDSVYGPFVDEDPAGKCIWAQYPDERWVRLCQLVWDNAQVKVVLHVCLRNCKKEIVQAVRKPLLDADGKLPELLEPRFLWDCGFGLL